MSHVQKTKNRIRPSYRAVITDPDAPSGKISKSFPKKSMANEFVTQQDSQRLEGTYITPAMGQVVFRERYDKWVASALNLRDSTKNAQEDFARSLVLPTFGEMAMFGIEMEVVQDWIQELVEANYAASTIHKAHQVLSKVMSYAVKSKHITTNPCVGTTLPRLEVEIEEQRFITPEQIAGLADVFDERYRLFVLLGGYAGLRASEAFGLRAGRIDRSRNEIDIVETCLQVRGVTKFDRPKTKHGKRRIEIPGTLWEELLDHTRLMRPDDLIFQAPSGGPMRQQNFRRRFWYPATIATGLGQMVPCTATSGACSLCKPKAERPAAGGHYVGLNIHDLRHTAVSMWIQNGSNPLQVSRRAGHSKVAFTFDRYGHIMPNEKDPTMNKLDALMRSSMGRTKVTPLHAVS